MKTKFTFLALLLIFNGVAQTQKGIDIDGEAAGDGSGNSVCMPDVNTVAIGACLNDGNGADAGHVRIYAWNGTAWVQKGIDIDGKDKEDYFGTSVSMPDANTVAIAALDTYGSSAGHVRIYAWNGTAWVQKGIDIDGEAADDRFGNSVSMPDSNTVAIGAVYLYGSGVGYVRIYTWNGTAWVQKGIDIDGKADDHFGWEVSMPDTNTVAIGTDYQDGSDEGYVRIYTWNGTAWVQKGIDIDGEALDDRFGASLNMPDANTVAIGGLLNDGSGTDAGHVRIYTWNGTAWVQKGIDIDGEAAADELGVSVSMPDANTVAIGGHTNAGNGFHAGHVRIYTWNGTAWVQKCIDIDGEATGDFFGISVSMPDTNTVAIGGLYNDGNGTDAGHVRVYNVYHICTCSLTSSIDVQTACNSFTWIDGNNYTASTNTPTKVFVTADGCDSIVTLNLTFPVAFVDAGPDVSVNYGENTVLNAVGTGIFEWSPAEGLSCVSCQSPVAQPERTTTYYVSLYDTNACAVVTDTVTVYVILACGEEIYVPNAFSPNGDGSNDRLAIANPWCLQSYTFAIYDRWGEIIYRQTNPEEGWDGTYKGRKMDPAVFVYMLNGVLSNGSTLNQKGNLTLVR